MILLYGDGGLINKGQLVEVDIDVALVGYQDLHVAIYTG
jgi:hypothetical protein